MGWLGIFAFVALIIFTIDSPKPLRTFLYMLLAATLTIGVAYLGSLIWPELSAGLGSAAALLMTVFIVIVGRNHVLYSKKRAEEAKAEAKAKAQSN